LTGDTEGFDGEDVLIHFRVFRADARTRIVSVLSVVFNPLPQP
jgi:hypothetical protein